VVDEPALIKMAAGGDHAAFRELVSRYHATIYRWALSELGAPDEAEDVAQLVLLKVYSSLATFRGGSRFSTWLYQITRNTISELARKDQRRATLLPRSVAEEPQYDESAVLSAIDGERLESAVKRCLANLPPRQREVFELADLQGFAPAEIAEMLNVEAVTVRTNLLKARRQIRTIMLAERASLLEEFRS
jgi:RNA polymerase sigma-70 factor (ECF subfamily)